MDKKMQKGDVVKVHYTGKFENGAIFDSSEKSGPLEFEIGKGVVIPGFELGILSMDIGQKKTIKILPENGYGPYEPELVFLVKLSQLPPHINPTVGLQLEVSSDQNFPIYATIKEITPDNVVLDANHPLAGKTLVFDIELLSVKKKG